MTSWPLGISSCRPTPTTSSPSQKTCNRYNDQETIEDLVSDAEDLLYNIKEDLDDEDYRYGTKQQLEAWKARARTLGFAFDLFNQGKVRDMCTRKWNDIRGELGLSIAPVPNSGNCVNLIKVTGWDGALTAYMVYHDQPNFVEVNLSFYHGQWAENGLRANVANERIKTYRVEFAEDKSLQPGKLACTPFDNAFPNPCLL